MEEGEEMEMNIGVRGGEKSKVLIFFFIIFFFFFQAEDGIRDTSVTGVQTCALPISRCGSAPTFYTAHFSLRQRPRFLKSPSLVAAALRFLYCPFLVAAAPSLLKMPLSH